MIYFLRFQFILLNHRRSPALRQIQYIYTGNELPRRQFLQKSTVEKNIIQLIRQQKIELTAGQCCDLLTAVNDLTGTTFPADFSTLRSVPDHCTGKSPIYPGGSRRTERKQQHTQQQQVSINFTTLPHKKYTILLHYNRLYNSIIKGENQILHARKIILLPAVTEIESVFYGLKIISAIKVRNPLAYFL